MEKYTVPSQVLTNISPIPLDALFEMDTNTHTYTQIKDNFYAMIRGKRRGGTE